MCEFCDSITDRNKEITWLVRSTYADDNICDFVNENICSSCNGCNMNFSLDGYVWDDNVVVGIKYEQKIISSTGYEVVVHPFSETIQFNYCPICGKQISKYIKDFKDYYEFKINEK